MSEPTREEMLAKILEFISMMAATPRSVEPKVLSIDELYREAKRGPIKNEEVEMVTIKASSFELLIRLAFRGWRALEKENDQ